MNKDVYVPETFDEWKRLHTERHMTGDESNQPTWVWDDHALTDTMGGYVCSDCKTINMNMPLRRDADYRQFSGITYCPSCGLKMNLNAVQGCEYKQINLEVF